MHFLPLMRLIATPFPACSYGMPADRYSPKPCILTPPVSAQMRISKPIIDGSHCIWAKYSPLLDWLAFLQFISQSVIDMPFSITLSISKLPLVLRFPSNIYEIWGFVVRLIFPTDLTSIFWPLKPTPFMFKAGLFYPLVKSWFHCDLYRPTYSFSKERLLFID